MLQASIDKEQIKLFINQLKQLIGEEPPVINWIREWHKGSNVPQERGENISMDDLLIALQEGSAMQKKTELEEAAEFLERNPNSDIMMKIHDRLKEEIE
jgi:hypothetical protein